MAERRKRTGNHPQYGVIQIKKAESTGKRIALLTELQRVRSQIKMLQLRSDQIVIMLRDEQYDGHDLFRPKESHESLFRSKDNQESPKRRA